MSVEEGGAVREVGQLGKSPLGVHFGRGGELTVMGACDGEDCVHEKGILSDLA